MASPDPPRTATLRTWLLGPTLLALSGAVFVTARLPRIHSSPCWGDIRAVSGEVVRTDLAGLPATSESGIRPRPGVALLGGFELRFTPILYRDEEAREIGRSSMRVVDPSSCAEVPIPVNEKACSSWVCYPMQLSFDAARSHYLVHNDGRVLAAFRKGTAPGVKRDWAAMAPALTLAVAGAAGALQGLVRMARGGQPVVVLALAWILVAVAVVLTG